MLISSPDVADHVIQLAEHPGIDLVQDGEVDFRWIKPLVIFEVAQHVAKRVAHLAIGFRHLLDAALAHADVVGVVHAGDIEPQDVGAVALDHHVGGDVVTERLREFALVFIHEKAVSEHIFERGGSRASDCGQNG